MTIYIGLVAASVVLAIAIFFLIAIAVAGVMDRVPVHSFPAATPIAADCRRSSYYVATNEAAQALGLIDCGERPFARGAGIGRVWLTPDRGALVLVASVRLAGLKSDDTRVMTMPRGSAVLTTTDSLAQTTVPFEQREILVNADLHELLDLHARRIAGAALERLMDGWAAYAAYERNFAAALVTSGLAVYVDGAQQVWRATWRSILRSQAGVFIAPFRLHAAQSQRFALKRSGHPAYVSSVQRAAAARQQRLCDEVEAELDDEDERC